MQNQKTMTFMSSAVFWGIIIVLIGVSIILREIFHVHLPFLRIVFGILLIYWGIKVLAGGFNRSWGGNSAVFSESKMNYDGSQKEYNVVFGSSNIDLFKMDIPTEDKKIEVNAVFGNVVLILNDSVPTTVEMNAVFGHVAAPDRDASAFGKTFFTNSAFKEGQPCLKIEANAVFGHITIQSKRW